MDGYTIGMTMGIIIGIAIGVSIGISIGKNQKPWSELTYEEKGNYYIWFYYFINWFYLKYLVVL